MKHAALSLLVLLVGSVAPASGQEWARKMFEVTNHDFGTVARGAKAEFSFQLKNIYEETVHVAGVRSSCGCTLPRIVNPTLKTYEVGQIVADFDTRRFLGNRSATITVTIDKPYFAEVRLRVKGYIRGDVVIQPGAVQFDSVDQGSIAERTITVKHAGNPSWQLVDIQSANHHFEVEISDRRYEQGQSIYELLVRLKDDAPAGYLKDQLVLVTNDHQSQQIPLAVEGRIVPDITVSPVALYLGDVKPGEAVTKKLVVRGRKPFRIVDLNCADDCFKFKSSDEAKALHLVDVTFHSDQPGKVEKTIGIKTDQHPGTSATVVAYVNVKP